MKLISGVLLITILGLAVANAQTSAPSVRECYPLVAKNITIFYILVPFLTWAKLGMPT